MVHLTKTRGRSEQNEPALKTQVFRSDNGNNLLFVDKDNLGIIHFSLMGQNGELLLKDKLEFDFDTFIQCIQKLGYHKFGEKQ
jgi:hypothetical protein